MPDSHNHPPLCIIGGGLAGIAAGFYAHRAGIPFRLFEGANRLGGACITFVRGGFAFDSGAHRLHNKDPQTTWDAVSLLGDDLLRVDVPSAIYDDGRFIPFPFDLADLLGHVGPGAVLRGAADLLKARVSLRPVKCFEDAAVRRYGRTVAQRFLLNYTQKLWGVPCGQLVPELTGGRLRGLDLREMLRGTLRASGGPAHLEGEFYYPRAGIGMLTDALVFACGESPLATGSQVTKVLHDGRCITGIVVGGNQTVETKELISTIPLDCLVRVLDPPLAHASLDAASALTYRHVILVALFLDEPSITHAATVYFPDWRFPFTRVVEPRNRSSFMSPPGQTSLLAEIPCDEASALWTAADEALVALIQDHLEEIGWVRPDRVVGTAVERMRRAYPVVSLEARDAVTAIAADLGRLKGLHLLGRNGAFHYAWIHNLMHDARVVISRISGS